MIKFKQRKFSFIITIKCLNNVVMINVTSYPVLFFFISYCFMVLTLVKLLIEKFHLIMLSLVQDAWDIEKKEPSYRNI